MRRRSFLVLTTALCVLPLGAISPPDVSVSGYTGVLSATANEYVYYADRVQSELVWPVNDAIMTYLGMGARWSDRLSLSGSIGFSLSSPEGTMADSDFMNEPSSPEKTHYSEHEALADGIMDVEVGASWRFILPISFPRAREALSVEPGLGFRSLDVSWSSSNGFTQYAAGYDTNGDGYADHWDPWNKNLPKTPIHGAAISYRQQFSIPFASVRMTVPLTDRLRGEASIEFAPFLAALGTDHHFKRFLFFYDRMSNGYMSSPSLKIAFTPFAGMELFAKADWTFIGKLRGDTVVQPEGSSSYAVYRSGDGEGGGAAFRSRTIAIGMTVTTD